MHALDARSARRRLASFVRPQEYMDHIAPLLQTLLWVILIAGIVFRFNKPLHGVLTALQERIESGSTVKAGPFEISEHVKTQDPAKQKEKVERDLQEILKEQPDSGGKEPLKSKADLQTNYLLAEDLAMRAVQDQYGVPITRKVTVAPDLDFDGVFQYNGRMHLVEVWYVLRSVHTQRVTANIE